MKQACEACLNGTGPHCEAGQCGLKRTRDRVLRRVAKPPTPIVTGRCYACGMRVSQVPGLRDSAYLDRKLGRQLCEVCWRWENL
jgi:hypothetical protein